MLAALLTNLPPSPPTQGGSRLQRAYEQLAAEFGEHRPRRRQPTVWPDFSPWAAREPAPDLPPARRISSKSSYLSGRAAVVEEAPVPEWSPPDVGDAEPSPRVQKLLRQIRALEREIAAADHLGLRRKHDEEDFLMMLFLSE